MFLIYAFLNEILSPMRNTLCVVCRCLFPPFLQNVESFAIALIGYFFSFFIQGNKRLYYFLLPKLNSLVIFKAPGLDGFPVECLKKGAMAVLEWLVRLLNLSFDMGVVPMDWRGACTKGRVTNVNVATLEVLVC